MERYYRFWNYSKIKRINNVKMLILSKETYRFNAITIKSTLFTGKEETTTKFLWTQKCPQMVKVVFIF